MRRLWQVVLAALAPAPRKTPDRNGPPSGSSTTDGPKSATGAGIPSHVHLHVLPRWSGDTNFMTTVAGTRVMPETLQVAWHKLTEVWPPV